MTRIITVLLFTIITAISLYAKEFSFTILNPGDNCQNGSKLWLLDNNDDNKFEFLVYGLCQNKAKLFNLVDKSSSLPSDNQGAVVISGSATENNFLIYLVDSYNSTYTHKIYYDYSCQSAVLENISNNNNEPITYDEADDYFYIRQIGTTLLITKKIDMDVQLVILCSIDGKIISQLPQVQGWLQFSFDMFNQPSGIYILRFIASKKALTKKIIYLR